MDVGLSATPLPVRASRPIGAWPVMAARCLGFAAVNIAFQVTGFAGGPCVEPAAGLAAMAAVAALGLLPSL